MVADPKLLTDDELEAIKGRISRFGGSQLDHRFLSHIAAQAAEIARLRSVPDSVFRYELVGDLYSHSYGLEESDKGAYLKYCEVLAEINRVVQFRGRSPACKEA